MTIKPCAKCGASERYTSGRCKPCDNTASAAYRAANPVKNSDRCAKYRAKTKETHKEKNNQHTRNWYERNKIVVREKKRIAIAKGRKEDPDLHSLRGKTARTKLRNSLFEIYGHKCVRCDFDDKRALTLDHKLNNGGKERKSLGETGVYRRARDNYLPDEYQILCMNCQFIKRVEDKSENQYTKAIAGGCRLYNAA